MSKADLLQIPLGTTDCPYVQVGTTATATHNNSSSSGSGSGSGNGNIAQLKRSRIEPTQGKAVSSFLRHVLLFLCGIEFQSEQ